MEDWEDEPVTLSLKEQPKNKWDDEDVDEDVKDSWEDEDIPSPATELEPPAEKSVPKPAGKVSEKKENTAKVANEVLSDPLAEKLRQQRLVEEADFKSTEELFGKSTDEKSLDNFIPKSENDFMEYAELLSQKLLPYQKSYHYVGLLKAVIRLSMVPLQAADAKEIASSISAIANEKIKVEKDAGKKKTVAKKKQLHVDKPDESVVVDPYDALDDYDFM